MKPFSKWTVEEVEDEFGLTLDLACPALQTWLQGATPVTAEDAAQLRQLAQKLARYVRDWNEEELKVYFIALLLNRVDFYGADYRPFLEREIAVEYTAGKKLWGVVDFLVAQGAHSPKAPLFFYP